MLPFRWGLLLGVVVLIACANGAAIDQSAQSEDELTGLADLERSKRSGRGYARGQTQSQYLNFGKPEEDGKAEAEANESGSRSVVSGSHGMGQAQSQFSSGDCSGCSGYQTGSSLDGSGGFVGRPDAIISLPGADAVSGQPGFGGQPGAGSLIGGQPGAGSLIGEQPGIGGLPGVSGGQQVFGPVGPGGAGPSVSGGQAGIDGAQPGFGVQPSVGGQPGYGTQPGIGSQTGIGGGQPGFGGQTGVGGQPGDGGQLGYGTQPGVGSQTGIGGGQPGFGGQTGVGGQPGYGTQPGVGGQPGIGGRQSDWTGSQTGRGGGQPGFGGQAGVGGQPGYGTQPGVGGQPGISGRQPGYGTQPGVGGQTGIGGQPGYGTQPGVGGQPGSGGGQPGFGGQAGVGGQQYGTQPGAVGQSVIGGGQPGYGTQPGVGSQTGIGGGQPGAGGTQYGGRQPGAGGVLDGQVGAPGRYTAGSGVTPSGAAGAGVPGAVSGGPDDTFSQAASTIGNGQASASAEGKKNGGTAKTQVSGTYSTGGSFSASAMTSDADRAASAQVTGNADGAMSQSQGSGGPAQSQAQVQVNNKDGGTKASSQSGGLIHQSQSEVQANDKGGLADAQSSGPGQTSSQAQIGFRPGQDTSSAASPGGGQASAQSGSHSGQSQSQIQGTSSFGVSYHGAAQSASGTKEQVDTYREQNRELFNTISQFGNSGNAVTDRADAVFSGPALTSESDSIPELQLKSTKTSKEEPEKVEKKPDQPEPVQYEEEEEDEGDEYDEDEYYNENPVKLEEGPKAPSKIQDAESTPHPQTYTQSSPTQKQQAVVAPLPAEKYQLVQKQNGVVNTYTERSTTESVPSGFRGTVNVQKKFHTKSLELHNTEKKVEISADTDSDAPSAPTRGSKAPRAPDSYVTVTKSVTGSMDNSKNPPQDNKNFQSTYYTKSSTCGYFTFSCNIVYGANGRSKICRPKAPANGKC
ncbi:uncharacterized PE-PGRS family protein PE_PGRS54 [Drosophila subobscura]|uniref:uncharacterized PE-PGRS family protein PE_PGRS54 n=1 Tax=Drosophila subobscura TaxID=7241 RepID=UPI00155ADBE3|nr:uncharacterized PE-PGRS family protein PE_PGRS54 [Drosophila subobscura]